MANRKDDKGKTRFSETPNQSRAQNDLPALASPSVAPRHPTPARAVMVAKDATSRMMHIQSRVLVTGGSGFLGSHLCERLVAEGADVICLDNFFTGAKRNIEPLLSQTNFELIRHDVTFPIYLEVDQIYNLACPASPIHYQHDPVQTTKTSVHGAINMLGLAKRVRAKILQASTSEVYGDPNVHPQTEDYWGHVNPIGPRSCYDEGKRCAETLFFDYHRQNKLRIKVARIFNTYGPRMHPNDGRVVSNFIVQALLSRDITIYGDGSQTRSFCYVDDLIDGLDAFDGDRGFGDRADQHRQSNRILHAAACRHGDRTDRLALEDRASSFAGKRSAPAPAGHIAGPGAAVLGAPDAPEGRAPSHHLLFRQSARRGGGARISGRRACELSLA